VVPVVSLFLRAQVRGSLYMQLAFALFVFLPWSAELSRSVVLSSFSLTLAFNIVWWTTLAHTDSFYALFTMGINLLLTAPASVSFATLSIAQQRIEIGFAMCFFLFALIRLVSLAICIYKARLYEEAGIASFGSDCKEYSAIMIAMIATSSLRAVALGALSWVLYKGHRYNNRASVFANPLGYLVSLCIGRLLVNINRTTGVIPGIDARKSRDARWQGHIWSGICDCR